MQLVGGVPLVSVIMGVRYQKSNVELLERAVNSILDQTVSDFEFLICEYDSTGHAVRRLERFAAEDGRIRILKGRHPGTLSQNLNDCLRASSGRYIARMDDDDFSHCERMARQLCYMERHPDIAFAGCNVSLQCAGKAVGVRLLPEFPKIRDFYMTQPFIHPSLMFRREALEAVGGYSEDPACFLCEDYDLLLRMYGRGLTGANLQEILLDYTVPATARGGRKMSHRWNETKTRWKRFRELGELPNVLPYVIKPLVVGLLPEKALAAVKTRFAKKGG